MNCYRCPERRSLDRRPAIHPDNFADQIADRESIADFRIDSPGTEIVQRRLKLKIHPLRVELDSRPAGLDPLTLNREFRIAFDDPLFETRTLAFSPEPRAMTNTIAQGPAIAPGASLERSRDANKLRLKQAGASPNGCVAMSPHIEER